MFVLISAVMAVHWNDVEKPSATFYETINFFFVKFRVTSWIAF